MASSTDCEVTGSTDPCLTPEKKTELLTQVRKLSGDTLTIDASFNDISRRLANLREANIPEKFTKDVQRLDSTCKELHSVRNASPYLRTPN